MNWKEELLIIFSSEKVELKKGKSNKKVNQIIKSTLEEIIEVLEELHITATCNDYYNELKVNAYGFIMNIDKAENNIKFTFHYLNPLEPNNMPPIRKSDVRIISEEEVSNDVIGTIFVERFKPYKKYYRLGL